MEPERASRAIKLALVGSTALLAGYYLVCRAGENGATSRPYGGHWWHGSSWFYGGHGGLGGLSAHSFSSRGGFGSTGHAHAVSA